MVAAFERRSQDPLAGRLLDALRAGAAAGGEEGPVRSAGLLVVDEVTWPVTDLRVDWHDDPVAELARLWAVWQPPGGRLRPARPRPHGRTELRRAR